MSRKFLQEYTMGAELGKGSFSAVYSAVHNATKEKYAIKVIDKSRLTPRDIESIETEIKMLATLDHPNVLKMHDHHTENNKVYIVTELCEGGELFTRISVREFYTETDAQAVLRSLAHALKHCHDKKIVHRDLKPENILLLNQDEDSPLKIADFGFAKQIDDAELQTGLGTPYYIAPEILMRSTYGAAVDMWSFGVIAYVLLCGYPPFYAENNPEMFNKIKKCEYHFDEQYWHEVSDGAKDLIRKLLVLNPAERLDIDGVLSHPWITSAVSTKDITPALDELRQLLNRRKLKRIGGVVMAMNKLQNAVRGGTM